MASGTGEVKQGLASERSLARFLRSLRKPIEKVRTVKKPARSWQHFALLAAILAAGAMRTESDLLADAPAADPTADAADCSIHAASGCDRMSVLLAGR